MYHYTNNINNVFDNHFYINLEERKDRNESIINELKKLDITPNRFNAIKDSNGAVGCTKSHIAVIEKAIDNDWDYVCIFEDDIIIQRDNLLKKRVNKLLNKEWDVLMLSGNNMGEFIESEFGDYIKVSRCFTTGAYIIKKHYYKTWLDNMKESVKQLEQSGDNQFCCDVYNHRLQQKDNWFLIIPICCYQKEDYSDIEKKVVDYKNVLIDYKKIY